MIGSRLMNAVESIASNQPLLLKQHCFRRPVYNIPPPFNHPRFHYNLRCHYHFHCYYCPIVHQLLRQNIWQDVLNDHLYPTTDTALFPKVGLLNSDLFVAPSTNLDVFVQLILPQCKFEYGSSLL